MQQQSQLGDPLLEASGNPPADGCGETVAEASSDDEEATDEANEGAEAA